MERGGGGESAVGVLVPTWALLLNGSGKRIKKINPLIMLL